MEQGLNEAVNIIHINRSIKGYKDKYFKEIMSLNNCTNEIKLRWFYIRLKRVVKGRHWTYAERKKIWKHYKLNDYTPCKIKFRLYLPHTNTII